MDIQKYLDRIKFVSKPEISKEVLFSLHRQHLLNIPFENLDIHYGRKIELELYKIFQKIVIDKRGGFCYELNALFHWLLQAIGFKAYLISGSVYHKAAYGKAFDHMAIVVDLDNISYLVDVGFGKFIFEPLEMVLEQAQIDRHGNFIIDRYGDDHFRVAELDQEKKAPRYIFTLKHRQLDEYNQMCNFHQTSEDSAFTKSKLISLPTFNGRITLTNNTLKISHDNQTKTTQFKDAEFDDYLYQYFNIRIAAGDSRNPNVRRL